jgi:anti-anti-sigma factor
MDQARDQPTSVEVVEVDDGSVLVVLAGEFDEFSSAPLSAVADKFAERPNLKVRIDAGRVTFASSAMVGALLRLHRATTNGGGVVGFTAVSPTLARVLEITSVSTLFDVPGDGTA